MVKIVKKFDEFVNEDSVYGKSYEDIPDCLIKIIEYINGYGIKTTKTEDGRIGSINDERDFINALRKNDDFTVINDTNYTGGKPDKITILVPKPRWWYDISVVDTDNRVYYVNIKSSKLNTNDNVGSITSILYGMFGKTSTEKVKIKAKQYAELFLEYNKHSSLDDFDKFVNIDYYYFVIDKNGGSFITSLNRFTRKSLFSNGSNLPFQCKWKYNSNKKMDKKEVCNIIMETIFDSLMKTVEIFKEKPIDTYRKNHRPDVDFKLF